jgi:hypothetical protein
VAVVVVWALLVEMEVAVTTMRQQVQAVAGVEFCRGLVARELVNTLAVMVAGLAVVLGQTVLVALVQLAARQTMWVEVFQIKLAVAVDGALQAALPLAVSLPLRALAAKLSTLMESRSHGCLVTHHEFMERYHDLPHQKSIWYFQVCRPIWNARYGCRIRARVIWG